jgi:tRNA1(Val) A37 N6-methylase TrmN6
VTVASTAAAAGSTPVREDLFLGGRLRLRQPVSGYRAGMDAGLLAAACAAGPAQSVFEAGCGAGAVLCQIAVRCPDVRLQGLERDPAMAALAGENLTLNGFGDRAAVQTGDVADRPPPEDRGRFDWAISNPPFFDDPGALRAPGPGKRDAWLADDGLQAWLDRLSLTAREGGRVLLIHRADRLADILEGLKRRCGSFAVLPVHPFADAPAKRVLVRAIRGGRAPLVLHPPLVLHARHPDRPTDEAAALFAGEAALEV